MARQKAKIERVLMRVPKDFRDKVYADAQAAGMNGTDYLEGKRVIVDVT